MAGLVTHRQRPPTARGVVFLSLEDETGMVNVICPPPVWERHRRVAVTAPALVVRGRIERTGAAGRAGAAGQSGQSGGAGGAANLLAAGMRPLRVAASRTGTAASRDFR